MAGSIDNVTIKSFIDKIIGNKDIIKDVSTTATIVSEGIVLTDYSLKAFEILEAIQGKS